MDDFINDGLEEFLQNDPHYHFYTVSNNEQGIVAMLVTSQGGFVDYNNDYLHLPFGKPWGFLNEDAQLQTRMMYRTLEIDYLAVRKDLREKGYGTRIISDLSTIARDKELYFITVEAYCKGDYSAIPFYEKMGFFPLQAYSSQYDTLRMSACFFTVSEY